MNAKMEKVEVVQKVPCGSAREFLEAISPWGEYFGREVQQGTRFPWVFRGQSNSDWPLLPKAFRPNTEMLLAEFSRWRPIYRSENGKVTNTDQASAEFYVLQNFYLLADQVGLSLPEDNHMVRASMHDPHHYLGRLEEAKIGWPPPELLSVMGLVQHHGLPTRLLDWTRNALTAAYFASVGAAREWMEFENSARPEEDQIRRSEEGMLEVLALDLDVTAKKEPHTIVSVTASRAGNPNLHAQEGLFTLDNPALFNWSGDADLDPLDKKLQRRLGYSRPALYRFQLKIKHARYLLTLLAREQVTAAKFFPGYDGVVKALLEKKWQLRAGEAGV